MQSNAYLFEVLQKLDEHEVRVDQGSVLKSLMPDGAYEFHEASPEFLNFTFKINDLRMIAYHRSNGASKIRFYDEKLGRFRSSMKVEFGATQMLEYVSRNYFQKVTPEVVVVSANQYMPIFEGEVNFILRLISILGSMLYPFAMSLSLPIFLYHLVNEKENRLLEIMLINGLRPKNYWLANVLCFALTSGLNFLLFFLFGYFVLAMDFFTQTSLLL